MKTLTAERLRELLSYDQATGDLTRLVGRSGPKARAGDIAGRLDDSGYIRIYVDGVKYPAHRLIVLWMTGEFPPQEVDHINGDRADNRWSNLRLATRSENMRNKGTYKTNTSGLRGVSFYKRTGKWKAQIQHEGKKIGLGYFASPDLAHTAYLTAEVALRKEFARAA
jgi:hypothetical protein